MKYAPDAGTGCFAGQQGYGYRSFSTFVDAVRNINAGRATVESYDNTLATIGKTMGATAIIEAGRLSLDAKGQTFEISYDAQGPDAAPAGLIPVAFGA